MATTTSATVALELGCPDCGETGELATIEQLVGTARCVVSRGEDGRIELDHEGYTEVCWDSSETIGIECQDCGFEYQGADWEALFSR